jgi:transcriptional regulator with XRE-family HTH domain
MSSRKVTEMDHSKKAGGQTARVDAGVGPRIREVRQALRLTQGALAEAIEVSKQAVVRYEAGRRLPRLAILRRIAQLSGRPVDWFWQGAEPTQRTMPLARESRVAEALAGVATAPESEGSVDERALARLPPRYQQRFGERMREAQGRFEADLERLKQQLRRELREYQRLLEAEWKADRRRSGR